MQFRHGENCGTKYAALCWSCLGSGDCTVCKGAGALIFEKCAVCLSEPWIVQLIQLYKLMKKGFLPAPGALFDQAHVFMNIYYWLDPLWAAHDRQAAEAAANRQK